MFCHAHNVGRDFQEQLDRQTKLHKTKSLLKACTNGRNLKTQTSSLQDEGHGSVRVRTKGEVKGGGTEKTEKRERDKKIAVSTCPLWVSIQTPTCTLPERASEGEQWWTEARNPPVVCRLWDSDPQV